MIAEFPAEEVQPSLITAVFIDKKTISIGEAGFIPVPLIYRISACVILLSLVPVAMLGSGSKAKGIKI